MEADRLLCTMFVAACIAGCGPSTPKKDAAVVAKTDAVVAKTEPPPFVPESPQECVPQGGAHSNTCQEISVTFPDPTNPTPKVTPDYLKMTTKQNMHIYWKLPSGCYFYRDGPDGVFLKDFTQAEDDQFSDALLTNDTDEDPHPISKGKRYHWKNKNKNGVEYLYKILFHCDGVSTQFVVDPGLKNGN